MSDYRFSRLVRLNSRDSSLESNSPFYYIFRINDNDLNQIKRVVLKTAIIPNTQYNINQYNNVFDLNSALSGNVNVTIPIGQYTTSTLITEINALVQPTLPSFVLSQDLLTQKLNFFNGLDVIDILTKKNNPLNTIADVIGIKADQSGTTFLADSLPCLTGLQHIYIGSQALSNSSAMITNDRAKINVFADLPVDVDFGKNQTLENSDNTSLNYSDFHSYKNLSSIDIELTDEHDNPIELNGKNFVLVFRVFS
jgi:hypothetical protein